MSGLLRRLHGEAGAVGGVEALPFGVLVFVVGVLLVANAWGVVDAKMATATAAREAVRAYVEAPAGSEPAALAQETARLTLAALGRAARAPDVTVEGSFLRCQRVSVTVAYTVPGVRLPWVGGIGATAVRSTASEIVDPLRSGVAGEAACV